MSVRCSIGSFRKGSVTPWLVLSLTAIVGIVALGTDGGRMMEEYRRVQTTSDAAALAAAAQLYENFATLQGLDDGSAASAASAIAAANGYGTSATSSVHVHIPPQTGDFAGKAGYVEVIVQNQLAATFGAIFTGKPLTVKTRSVAQGQPYKIGIIVLNPTAAGALSTKDLAAVVSLNAPIIVNSSAANALSNGGLALTASSFQITGGYTSSGLMLGPVQTGAASSADPLWSLPAPNSANYVVQSQSRLQINFALLPTVLQPGIYIGGIALNSGAIAVMEPGVYILDGGGLTISGVAALAGTGVMIYNTSITQSAGPINIGGVGAIVLTPPTSGTYEGISFFQDRAVNQPIAISAIGVLGIQGTIYAPNAAVSLTASVAVDLLLGGFISDTLTLAGSASVSLKLGSNPKAPNITLVE